MSPFLNIQHDYELACLGNWPKTQLLAGDQRSGFGLIIIIGRAKPARLEAPNDEIIVKMKTTWRKYLSDTASSVCLYKTELFQWWKTRSLPQCLHSLAWGLLLFHWRSIVNYEPGQSVRAIPYFTSILYSSKSIVTRFFVVIQRGEECYSASYHWLSLQKEWRNVFPF